MNFWRACMAAATLIATCAATPVAHADPGIQLGPRPYYLIDLLSDGPLKTKLQSCAAGPFKRTAFSIGHRGAPMQFPEHTRESYTAAARMAPACSNAMSPSRKTESWSAVIPSATCT